MRFLILLAFVLGTVYAQTHNCINGYKPSNYIGKRRVPTTCNLQQLDLIGSLEFLKAAKHLRQWFTRSFWIVMKVLLCVHIRPDWSKIWWRSWAKWRYDWRWYWSWKQVEGVFTSLLSTIINRFEPHFGLKRNLAACAAIKFPWA